MNENKQPKTSFPKSKIKIILLENIDPSAIIRLNKEGFDIQAHKGSLEGNELKEKIKDAHVIGIRSKTKLTADVLSVCRRLLCIGCFCIGTDQVDLSFAEKKGIPVFNSPFCNSRSVAELMISWIITLARKLGDRNIEMHKGIWNKSSSGCHEIRGKTLGIVGYGHIGSQLSVMAEAMGLKVIFYDIENIMPLGNSKPCDSLHQLLQTADFVTLHVPKTEQTVNMITAKELQMMKKGSYLLNASRGTVVDLEALTEALKSGHLAGAAVDVFPWEPEKNTNDFRHPLQDCPNIILTPHIGGSTEEAQHAIGAELADKIVKLINCGTTSTAVNFPNCELKDIPKAHRILNIHRNVPGVLRNINEILQEANVMGQVLSTSETIGYLIVDVDRETSDEIKQKIKKLPSSIKTRILY